MPWGCFYTSSRHSITQIFLHTIAPLKTSAFSALKLTEVKHQVCLLGDASASSQDEAEDIAHDVAAQRWARARYVTWLGLSYMVESCE